MSTLDRRRFLQASAVLSGTLVSSGIRRARAATDRIEVPVIDRIVIREIHVQETIFRSNAEMHIPLRCHESPSGLELPDRGLSNLGAGDTTRFLEKAMFQPVGKSLA